MTLLLLLLLIFQTAAALFEQVPDPQARLATRDTADDPARSARASARGASGARAAASNHWRLQLQQCAAARSIDLMGAAKNQKEAGG